MRYHGAYDVKRQGHTALEYAHYGWCIQCQRTSDIGVCVVTQDRELR
jgi:hypothetical protein